MWHTQADRALPLPNVALALDVYWLSKQQTPPVPVAVALLLVIIVELLAHYPGR